MVNSSDTFFRLLPYRTRRLSRKILSWLKRQYSDAPKSIHWANGLPDGLDYKRLNKVCVNRFGKSVKKVVHYHLSGWKASGAYRLKVWLTGDGVQQLVFKNAVYNLRQIPALSGFPVLPGPPEHEIYLKGRIELRDYLPDVYDIEEVIPGRHYKYLFDNLRIHYRFPETAELKLKIVENLPALHQTLASLEDQIDSNRILHYDQEFSCALQDYARESLERYQKVRPDPELGRLLEKWEKITDLHGREDIRNLVQPGLIHGDLNFSNVFLPRNGSNGIKLVDWEWAGIGLPHADLAALMKGTPAEVEDVAIRLYASLQPHLSLEEHKAVYTWCQLERSLNDAAFVAAQLMESSHEAKINLPRFVEMSVRRIFVMVDRLERLGV